MSKLIRDIELAQIVARIMCDAASSNPQRNAGNS
jgi:hypothetical protein